MLVWFDQRVSVIVPCYRESRLIGRTLARIPTWVDSIHVVDDGSDDGTDQAVLAVHDPRIELLRHPDNRGVGAAILSGYRRAIECGSHLLVVMAGDNQMDPADLPMLLRTLLDTNADYVKGNRFQHHERRRMPFLRRVGGSILSFVTRRVSGLSVSDAQCGYTVLRAKSAMLVPLETMWPRFGYPNDLLIMLAARGKVIRDVPVRPVYADERSGIRFWHIWVVLYVILRRLCIERFPMLARMGSVVQDAE